METAILFTIPTRERPNTPGAIFYRHSAGYSSHARGIHVAGERIYAWDSTSAQAFDITGKWLCQYTVPDASGSIRAIATTPQHEVYLLAAITEDRRALYRYSADGKSVTKLSLPPNVTCNAATGRLSVDEKQHLWLVAKANPLEELRINPEMKLTGEKRPALLRCGAYYFSMSWNDRAVTVQFFAATGKAAEKIIVPQTLKDAQLIRYYNGDTYLGVFGTEPEDKRSLTLYAVTPNGIVPKIRLPAIVLFGGDVRVLLPDGVKYYLEYNKAANNYSVTRVKYDPHVLGLDITK